MNPDELDEHLNKARDKARCEDIAAHLRDIASRQLFLADDPGRTPRDVVDAILTEASNLEHRAHKIHLLLRGES